jgi:tRNA(Ile)-lysidine synthase
MLEHRVLDFFTTVCPTEPGDTLLVAVSGGPDSVALLHLLLRVRDSLGLNLHVAHLNHGIRGSEAREDARFVADLASEEGLTLHGRSVDVPVLQKREGGSLEALARRERYAFLEEARAVAGAKWVVTGHTANDQVETFLLNMVRGAGPRGLGGMLPVGPGSMCRPLLTTWRHEILAYLEKENVTYRVDSSNLDISLTRNRIRERVVPLLTEEFGNGVTSVLARESQLMNEVDEFLSLEGARILRSAALGQESVEGGPEIRLSISELKKHHKVLQRSAIRAAVEDLVGDLEEVTLAHVDAVLDLCRRDQGTGGVDLARGLAARREYEALILCPAEGSAQFAAPQASPPLELSRDGEIRWGAVHLRWTLASAADLDLETCMGAPERSCFEREALVPPVYLRAARAGDRIEPLGMEGSQKISDLLINRKVPRRLRTRVALLCDNGGAEGGERVLWVTGHRRAGHAPVRPDTSQVVMFQAETII